MPFSYGDPIVTTAAEVSRNFGRWQDEAINGPVVVTHHGRIRVVLISAAQYSKWSRGGLPVEAPLSSDEALEARLSALLAYTRDGFLAVDRAFVIIEANRAAEDFYGRTRAKLVGAHLFEAVPGSEGSVIVERMKRVAVSGRADRLETRSAAFPNRLIHCEIFPYHDGVGVLIENLTDTNEAQRRAEQFDALTACVSAAPQIASMTINLRGSIETVSDRLVEWLSLRGSEVVGLRLQDLLVVEDRVAGRKAIEQVFRGLEPQAFSVRLLSNEGADVRVSCQAAPIRASGLLSGVYVLLTHAPELPAVD
jgi:PAS domain S-box-containing protein